MTHLQNDQKYEQMKAGRNSPVGAQFAILVRHEQRSPDRDLRILIDVLRILIELAGQLR